VRRHLTFANVVACIALFVALGGSAVAAKTAIDGSQIRKGSLPADRLKKDSIAAAEVKADSLTGAQIQEGTLATVPSAAHAGTADSAETADNATSAGHADESMHAEESAHAADSTHASDADTLAGFGPGAFAPASEIRTGVGNSQAVPATTILSLPEVGVKVETDGNADFDQSVVIRNTGATNLFVDVPFGVGTIQAGKTTEVTGSGDSWTEAEWEAVALLQRSGGPSALIHCYFPEGGGGAVLTFCEGSAFAAP
jgi:hypothetical protein